MNQKNFSKAALMAAALLPAMMYGPGKLSIDHFLRRKYLPDL